MAKTRRHNRVPAPGNLLVSTEFSAVNLSNSGMALQARRAYAPGEVIKLELRLNQEILISRAKVVWCKPAGNNPEVQGYELGVEFEKLLTTTSLLLRNYKAQKMAAAVSQTQIKLGFDDQSLHQDLTSTDLLKLLTQNS